MVDYFFLMFLLLGKLNGNYCFEYDCARFIKCFDEIKLNMDIF